MFDLVRRERFARDQQRFDVMRACFHDEAYIRTSWYDGHGGEAYVEATRKWMASRSSGKHWVFPAFAKIAGDRATVESPAMIFNRVDLAGTEADFYVFCRFFSRAVRQDETWKLLSFEVLFERDTLYPVNAGETLALDLSVLNTLRRSYRFLSYIQLGRGVKVNPDLLGDDQLDRLQAFHQGEDRWLAGES
ncbi:MAG TPA: nuclear transport factor 2 family protein [Devosia sp.]|nr:nuclear transport factor 2 family protein [Devosia sp.]